MKLLNRTQGGAWELPADGWYHMAPLGEFPGEREIEGGRTERVLQVVDAQAITAMVNRFKQAAAGENFPGVLIDFDHFSHSRDKSSEAAGWIEDLQNRDTGLWAKIRWSDSGEAAVKGGRFRLISPVWDGPSLGNSRVRPEVLLRAGLTNDPNLRGMVPLSNRAGDPAHNENTMKLTESTILALLAAVGLPSDATDEQVQAKLGETKETMNRGREYPGLKTQHDTLVDSVAEGDLDANGIKDKAEREAIKPMLISNRAGTLALLKRGEKPAKETSKAPVHNRAGAPTPPSPAEGEGDGEPTEAERAKAARISNRASELLAAGNGRRNYSECFAQARAEEEGRE